MSLQYRQSIATQGLRGWHPTSNYTRKIREFVAVQGFGNNLVIEGLTAVSRKRKQGSSAMQALLQLDQLHARRERDQRKRRRQEEELLLMMAAELLDD